ncbi:MAG TPA: putative quinol monooxygenase [Candidatus Acidoferrales bacterium]|nr:putative quinol monooxygenase [Candidatus Acidoferrales bacterium]
MQDPVARAEAIVQVVRYRFESTDAGRAEALLRELRDASRKEKGVVAFDVGRSREDSNVFILWEIYRDAAALDEHAGTGHFRKLVVDGIRRLATERKAEFFSAL